MNMEVRYYKGERIPWKPHDCTESNTCAFCRREKRRFISALNSHKAQTPMHTFDRFGPVRLCCGKRHFGVVCPDGMVMCSICFERVPESKLSRCADGRLENVCIQCALDESHQASREPDPTPAPEAPAS